jgi:hypothetical protein
MVNKYLPLPKCYAHVSPKLVYLQNGVYDARNATIIRGCSNAPQASLMWGAIYGYRRYWTHAVKHNLGVSPELVISKSAWLDWKLAVFAPIVHGDGH